MARSSTRRGSSIARDSGSGNSDGLVTAVADLRGQIPPMTVEEIAAIAGGQVKVTIPPPNMKAALIAIVGTAPYVQHKFSAKARAQMEETQRAGPRSRSRKVRQARDFEADWLAAQHVSEAGWHGIPTGAWRNAMISACRLVGFVMTKAKLSLFVDADGYDQEDGITPLTRLDGELVPFARTKPLPVRNETGVADLRIRPMWRDWRAVVPVRWDGDQFNEADVVNLFARAGKQVGIGEGRPDSPQSNGMGWGLFDIEGAL